MALPLPEQWRAPMGGRAARCFTGRRRTDSSLGVGKASRKPFISDGLTPKVSGAGAEGVGHRQGPGKWRSHGPCWRPLDRPVRRRVRRVLHLIAEFMHFDPEIGQHL